MASLRKVFLESAVTAAVAAMLSSISSSRHSYRIGTRSYEADVAEPAETAG